MFTRFTDKYFKMMLKRQIYLNLDPQHTRGAENLKLKVRVKYKKHSYHSKGSFLTTPVQHLVNHSIAALSHAVME